MTRTGVTLDGSAGQGSYASKNWETAATCFSAHYIQWSIEANNDRNIILPKMDIRYRRFNNQGPRSIQIYYRLHSINASEANSVLIPVNTVQTYLTNDNEQKTLSLPFDNIESGNSGRITFRLYGWDAVNTNGELTIESYTAWAGNLGIANPGIRFRGNVNGNLIFLMVFGVQMNLCHYCRFI